VFDLWKAKSDKLTPLVVFIHGGGFAEGSKERVSSSLVRGCLNAGISVAAINYRLTDAAPYPAQMLDAARAMQYLRWKAQEFNLDPKRFGCTGGSAGGGISLWLAFREDLADPKSSDPVLRQSTRITCAVGRDAQCSYDPRWIKQNIGGLAYQMKALRALFRVGPEELLTDKAAQLYEDASPITHLTKDDPPVRMYYVIADAPSDEHPGKGIHSPKFGQILHAEMDKLGIECEFAIGSKGELEDRVNFFVKHLNP
jgi:pimeloyl-ACP methyl ester carboxylesterase